MVTQSTADTDKIDPSLFALRFPHKVNRDGVLPDHFIKLWNDLAYFSNNLQSKGQTRHAAKYIASFLDKLAKCTAPEEQKLAQLSESAGIYLKCCNADKRFSSDFLGTMQLQENRVHTKLVQLVYDIGVVLMQKTGLEQEAALLSQALIDGFTRELPQLLTLYHTIEEQSGFAAK